MLNCHNHKEIPLTTIQWVNKPVTPIQNTSTVRVLIHLYY